MRNNAKVSKKASVKIPKRLQAVLWSVSVDQLDLDRDRNYIIQQVLLYGTFEDIRWLLQRYSRDEIVESFVAHPIKMYPRMAFYFIKNFILPLKIKDLAEEKYVTSISGPVRPRATASIQEA